MTTTTTPAGGDLSNADPGDCIVVDMAVSSEKIALLTTLAEEFNESDAEVDGSLHLRPATQRGVGSRRRADPGGLAEP